MRVLYLLLILLASTAGVIWAGQYGYGPVVIVNEWEYRIPLLLGAPWREPISEPGLAFRIPFIETMESIDKRLQYLNAAPAEVPIENEVMIVDYFAIWRISDPLEFRRSFPGLIEDATPVISRRLQSEVGATVSKMPLSQLLGRARVLSELGEDVSASLRAKGVEILDVRINRTELPERAEQAAYEQMREQRHAISREHRARGETEAREVRAKASREARTLLAQATAGAEKIRGEGDAESAAIYAEAYDRDPEFYAFVRSLETYRATLGTRTTMVLPPGHALFRFLDPSRQEASLGLPAPVKSRPPVTRPGE